MRNTPFKHGSRPVTVDARDEQFQHHRIFGTTTNTLAALPQHLGRKPGKIKDQGDTNFCTAFATSTASEFQEGVELSPEFQAAKVGEMSGAPIVDGADPRMALKAAQIFGSLPQLDTDYTLASKTPSFIADWNNWPAPLDLLADPHEKESYFQINTGPFDAFDNIRVALAQGFAENAVGIAFTQWKANVWNTAPAGFINLLGGDVSGYHAYVYIDFDETFRGTEVLVVQNSCGTNYGDAGLQYFTRDVINSIYADPGSSAFMFRDLSAATVAQLNLPYIGPLLRYLRFYFPSITRIV